MPSTYTLISSNVLSSSAASVTFSAIPSTYTDLVVRISSRSSAGSVQRIMNIEFNADSTTKYSDTLLTGDGSTATSTRESAVSIALIGYMPASTATANTFGSAEIYIPNYNSTSSKPLSSATVSETNATAAYIRNAAALYTGTSGITSLRITPSSGTMDIGSSFYLYGIKNS